MEFVIQTLLSGLISSLVVFLLTIYYQKREEKVRVITELVGRSYQLARNGHHEDIVYALNRAYIVFAKNKEVITLLENFKQSLGNAQSDKINDLLIRLIREMCKKSCININHITDASLLKPFM
mgnify:CR=1 FL=1